MSVGIISIMSLMREEHLKKITPKQVELISCTMLTMDNKNWGARW
jgi:hypothetical protein